MSTSNSTSTFSYAQAAKGQLPAQVATSQQSPNQSQTPSVTGTQSRDANTTSTSTRAPSVAVSTLSNDNDSSRSVQSTSAKPDASRLNGVEANQDDVNTVTSVAGSTVSSKVGMDLPPVDGVARSTESRGRSINPGSDAGEHYEGKKSKKPRKGKSAEKESEAGQELEKEIPPPKVELSEAPLPSVNFWVQRQQTAQAKVVDQPANASTIQPQTYAESKTRSSPSEAVEGNRVPFNGKQGSKKDGEPSRNGNNQGPKKAGPRGARTQEKEPDTNLLANNPASWPTPETAAVNLKVQPQAQPEKSEKEDKEDASAAKPKQKKEWVHLPNFVPSVKFETALPGRGPRGGRAGGSRGGRDAAGSHQATASSTDRPQETNASSRTNSGPKRAPIEGSGPREGRKNIPHAEHPKVLKEPTPDNTNGEQLKANQPGVVNGITHEQLGQPPVLSQDSEENVKSSDSHKDIRTQSNRDAHPQGQNGSNHRSGERLRGGGRGRGGFNQNNPNGMSHYPQNPYTTQHHAYQFPPNGSRHMAPYGTGYQPMSYSFPGQPGPGQRKSTNGNRRQGSGRVPTMAPMNVPYDTNMYPPPNGGIFPYDSGNLIQLIQSQVEYYFSTENFVKDWYMRTHMDSQGFVPMNLIASFNRMRELVLDINILRQACIDSTVVELVMSGDGVERVRSKEGWEKWVIPDKNLRDPAARHDGPSTWHSFSTGFQHSMLSPQYPVETPQVFSPTNEHGFTHYPNGNYGVPPLNVATVNGINGHARPQESQLSAAVPEFSPSTTSTFNGLKSASQTGSENKKGLVNRELNGVTSPHEHHSSVTNGVMHNQSQTSIDASHPTNGVGPTRAIEGH
ncbi:hypothetical protein E0Z10_g9939 [Xylaria hypoxylon]|uniref:HTH La-type RNA-binding domain-containing protein n=1 Tax=Xylaria hypoxylon TaxID=37992 RepID=A0A4Z0YHT5_9PEZI|nr:hypothetical protein E0Z10_g9939 [Xylaria hypoxylon]